MQLSFFPTELPDVIHITGESYEDDRGLFTELYRADAITGELGIDTFLQSNMARSAAHALRGLHYQVPPHDIGKLVICLRRQIFDVAVDIRHDSETYGRWVGKVLSHPAESLWIPAGFAHGYYSMEPSIVLYNMTNYYHKASDRSIKWDDPSLDIDWPLVNRKPLVSDRDTAAPSFEEASKELESFVTSL